MHSIDSNIAVNHVKKNFHSTIVGYWVSAGMTFCWLDPSRVALANACYTFFAEPRLRRSCWNQQLSLKSICSPNLTSVKACRKCNNKGLLIDSLLIALIMMPSPLPTKKPKSPNTPHLHQVSHPRQPSRDVRRVHELNINMRDIDLVEVKYCEDTRPGHQEASKKEREVLCKCLKAKKVILHIILLCVGGSTYLTHFTSP